MKTLRNTSHPESKVIKITLNSAQKIIKIGKY